MRRAAPALLAVLLLAPSALAQDQPPRPKKPKMICRSEPETGSRFANSTCHTAEEWKAIDDANSSSANKFMNGLANNAGRAGIGSGAPH